LQNFNLSLATSQTQPGIVTEQAIVRGTPCFDEKQYSFRLLIPDFTALFPTAKIARNAERAFGY
jgi:hypothetical protein